MDEQKLQEFLGRALVDLGGAVNAVLMSIGDELGLYKALAKGPRHLPNFPAIPTPTSVMFASGLTAKPRVVTSRSTRLLASTRSALNRSCVSRTPRVPSICQVRRCSCRTCSTYASAHCRISGPAKAWSGENITPACSAAPSGFSAPDTIRISFRLGSQHSTALKRN